MTSGCLQANKFQKKKEIQSNQSAFWGSLSLGRICQIPKYVTKRLESGVELPWTSKDQWDRKKKKMESWSHQEGIV